MGSAFEQLYVVSVSTDIGIQIGNGRELPIQGFLNRSFHRSFDMFRDGERMIAVYPEEEIRPQIYFVQNCYENMA